MVVLGLMLAVTYNARLCAVIIPVAFAPPCLACHAPPPTNGAARMWWRSLVSVLTIQVAHSAVLVTALRARMLPLPMFGVIAMRVAAATIALATGVRSVLARSSPPPRAPRRFVAEC